MEGKLRSPSIREEANKPTLIPDGILVCPKELFDKFKTEDEEMLGKAREEVIDWLSANIDKIAIGGLFIVPNPKDGKPECFTKISGPDQ